MSDEWFQNQSFWEFATIRFLLKNSILRNEIIF